MKGQMRMTSLCLQNLLNSGMLGCHNVGSHKQPKYFTSALCWHAICVLVLPDLYMSIMRLYMQGLLHCGITRCHNSESQTAIVYYFCARLICATSPGFIECVHEYLKDMRAWLTALWHPMMTLCEESEHEWFEFTTDFERKITLVHYDAAEDVG